MKTQTINIRALLILFLFGSSAFAHPKKRFGWDLMSLSYSPWVTTNDNSLATSKDAYFHTVNTSLYFHIGKTQGYVALPIMVTVEKYADSTRWASYPTDLIFYFSRKLINGVSPFVGAAIPFGYPADDNTAWIGSRNHRLLIGTNYRIGQFINKRLAIGGQGLVRYFLTGRESGARFGQGSITGYLSTKFSWKFNKRWGTGIEFFPYFGDYSETDWSNNWEGWGGVTYLSASYQPKPKLSFGLKAGMGKSFAGEKDVKKFRSNVYNGAVSMSLYLW